MNLYEETLNQVRNVIDGQINPMLASHNGACELVSLNESVALIKLKGGCQGCPGRQLTFLKGIKPILLNNCSNLLDVKLDVE